MKLNLRVIVVLLAFAAPAAAERLELPIQGLEDRVEFWKKVYTQYGGDDVIVHDRYYVNLIYDIADDDSVKSRVSVIKAALEEISSNLDAPETLSLPAAQIYAVLGENAIPMTPSVIRGLADTIHTQRGIKERFREGIIRSGKYVEGFQDIFDREGVPATIALLPLVESSFENRSLSKAGAAGIWQFTRGTGRLYLKITKRLDERLDPAKATRAAARLLRDNYRALGSWPLAITAYNHGRAGMQRAQAAHGSELNDIVENYRGSLFGYASMNFYAEFAAAVHVYENYPLYFGELVLDKPAALTLAKATVAAASAPKAKAAAAAASSDKYKVRKGDTLWQIAQRFGTSIRELMEMNNLEKSAIYAGQILVVK